MILILGLIICIILLIMMNLFLKRISKEIKKEHYIFGYLFILYLMISLLLVVGTASLNECKMCMAANKPIFHTDNLNLIPLQSLDFTNILNVILFMPFGFLLPTLWQRYYKLLPTILYGFIFSVIIEVSQLFTMNRTSDIDDIICNTLGTICGWIIFKFMSKIFSELASKTVVKSDIQNNIIMKLEPYIYVLIALVTSFLQ